MKKFTVKLIGYSLLAALSYSAICLLLFVYSMVSLNKGIVLSNRVLNSYQSLLYYGGFTGTRHVWQVEPGCVDFDQDLLYKPKIGECLFENYEFSTRLHFDAEGRVTNHGLYSEKPGVAVVGDSHAMGWGVEDAQTFSALLESKIGRPVYNLGVSSYGTYRELLRLEKSGLLSKVDTIIIQYSDNDIDENIVKTSSEEELARMVAKSADNLPIPLPADSASRVKVNEGVKDATASSPGQVVNEKKFESMHKAMAKPTDLSVIYPKIKVWVTEALRIPIRVGKSYIYQRKHPYDFINHMENIDKVFAKFPWLSSKRVIFFYINSHQPYNNHRNRLGMRFSNYLDVTKEYSKIPIEFVDIYPGLGGFFALDDHMNSKGHEYVAGELARIFSK